MSSLGLKRDEWTGVLKARVEKLLEDFMWGEKVFEELFMKFAGRMSTQEEYQIMEVPQEDWQGFVNMMVDRVVRDGAPAKQELEAKFAQARFSKEGELFDISLNYDLDGSHYISCAEFTVQKKWGTGDFVVAYSWFEQRWKEQSDYSLNRAFWESPATKNKLKNFLLAGASQKLIQAMASPDAEATLKD